MSDVREWTVSLDHGDNVVLRLHDAWRVAMLEIAQPFDGGEVPIHAGQLRSLAFAAGEAADLLEARTPADPAEVVERLVDAAVKDLRPE